MKKRKNVIYAKYFDYTILLTIFNFKGVIRVLIERNIVYVFSRYYIIYIIKKKKFANCKKLSLKCTLNSYNWLNLALNELRGNAQHE